MPRIDHYDRIHNLEERLVIMEKHVYGSDHVVMDAWAMADRQRQLDQEENNRKIEEHRRNPKPPPKDALFSVEGTVKWQPIKLSV